MLTEGEGHSTELELNLCTEIGCLSYKDHAAVIMADSCCHDDLESSSVRDFWVHACCASAVQLLRLGPLSGQALIIRYTALSEETASLPDSLIIISLPVARLLVRQACLRGQPAAGRIYLVAAFITRAVGLFL